MSSVAGIFLWWKLLFPLGWDPKTTEECEILSSSSVGLLWFLMEGLPPSHWWLRCLCSPCSLGPMLVPGKNCWWRAWVTDPGSLGDAGEVNWCELCSVNLLKYLLPPRNLTIYIVVLDWVEQSKIIFNVFFLPMQLWLSITTCTKSDNSH